MFTMAPLLPSHTPHTFNFNYTPYVPSPLSSSPLRAPSSRTPSPLQDRDANTSPCPASSILGADDTDLKMTSPTPSPRKSPSFSPLNFSAIPLPRKRHSSLPSPPPSRGKKGVFSKRIVQPNPLLNRSNGEQAETRRKLFLEKVKERRWERRTGGDEELQRVLWATEERERRIKEKIRADSVGLEGIEEEETLDEMLVEEVAAKEEAEVEALVSEWMAAPSSSMPATVEQRKEIENWGSDEDEYDEVFMDFVELEGRSFSSQQDHEMMDMS